MARRVDVLHDGPDHPVMSPGEPGPAPPTHGGGNPSANEEAAHEGPARELPSKDGSVLRAGTSRSPLRAYQDLVVGSRSWLRLIHYELAVWATHCPGALGVLLRKLLVPGLLSASGGGTVWGHGVVLRHPGKMCVGEGVVIDDLAYFDAKGCAEGEFQIGDEVFVSRGCIVSGKDGPLRLGARVNLGEGCTLYASTVLEIGADTMLAAKCYVGGGRYDPHGDRGRPLAQQPLPRKGVRIGEDCWLGAGVTVVDGVTIGRGAVIGAGAVVTEDVAPYSIAAGIPARRVGTRGEGHKPQRAGSRTREAESDHV